MLVATRDKKILLSNLNMGMWRQWKYNSGEHKSFMDMILGLIQEVQSN